MEGPLNDVILFLSERNGNREEKIDATRLSDGTLRCLSILAALLSENEYGMLVIEEADNGIHPGRIEGIITFISQIAQKRNLDAMSATKKQHQQYPESGFGAWTGISKHMMKPCI